MYYVYILESLKNSRYYIGSTNNIQRRLEEHNAGKTKSLKYLRPLRIVFSRKCKDRISARRLEAKLKQYKSRSIIEQIVRDQNIASLEGP